ncbi:MAG: NAD/NADP octopine/nopaline dehydrogenase family protein [Gammaproteobacteria bacterium]|nr:NAD/NADP octopine/nopaline dehydrogenase family protein [Gammaproteobacteria bacterium]MDE0414195.1 NAD/NADP octopine/nopaline dehydrogenase family protein [Gammaproteobacteria bacterium]MDE0455384.1 NAD/NADP octopine/nopaline dehydrogenase family protein [Gammaproteobacteria bacterium]
MKIAVLGGGAGCYAAAADLSEQGHSVRLWRRDAAALRPVVEHGGTILKDSAGRREVPLAMATADMREAVSGAELILIPLPAFAQPDIARELCPHLVDGQAVFLPPGTFGSYLLADRTRRCGNPANVLYAETGTLPYLTRKHGPREVAITVRARRLPTGVFPAARTEEAVEILQTAYPSVEPVEDVLSGALMNAGPIIHPPLILMNAGPLEHFPEWDIHNEGTQASVRHVTNALDEERIAIRESLGYSPYHFPLRDHYETDRWMYGDAHQALVDSGDWREHIDLKEHRYMREDVALGLAFMVSVADRAGVDAPVARGLLAMGSAVCGHDFLAGPRTLEALGLERLDAASLKQLLNTGFGE